jgi:hypothetical protein
MVMTTRTHTVLTSTLVLVALGCAPPLVGAARAAEPHVSECSPSDRIDQSTADMAVEKMERAGFTALRDLKKSCDNFWHGTAVRDGVTINIVLSPQGRVLVEGK